MFQTITKFPDAFFMISQDFPFPWSRGKDLRISMGKNRKKMKKRISNRKTKHKTLVRMNCFGFGLPTQRKTEKSKKFI